MQRSTVQHGVGVSLRVVLQDEVHCGSKSRTQGLASGPRENGIYRLKIIGPEITSVANLKIAGMFIRK